MPVTHIVMMNGSVIPKAVGWALAGSLASILVNVVYYDDESSEKMIASTWFSYSFLLSFLVVFRTQSAYSRYWEGAGTLQSIKGNLANAASCLFAFCSNDPAKKGQVQHFQHLMVRLMSLLHCSGLQWIAQMDDEAFDVFDLEGIDEESIAHLVANKDEKHTIVLQWIQKHVIEGINSGVLSVAPPIASRIFQQLGQGVIQLSAAKKISDIPFPFPCTQMVTLLLCIFTVVTPIVTGLMIKQTRWACALTFLGIFGFWAINYIAAEIEMPFGDDKNDLPIRQMQDEFNRSMALLLQSKTQSCPAFTLPALGLGSESITLTRCNVGLEPQPERSGSRVAGLEHSVIDAAHKVGVAAHHMVASIGHHHHKDHTDHGNSSIDTLHPVSPAGLQKGGVVPVGDAPAPHFGHDHHLEAGTQQLVNLGTRIERRLEEVSKDVGDLRGSAAKLSSALEKLSQRPFSL